MMQSLIERVDRWLAANRPDYYARLRTGATDAELDAFEARFSLRLPGSFRAFYRWRDGQESGCTASFQNNRVFMSLEEAAEAKELLDGMIGGGLRRPTLVAARLGPVPGQRWWRPPVP